MSNHVDKGKQPMNPYQSVWMSHWPALEDQNQLSNRLGQHGNDHGTNQWLFQKSKEIIFDISGSVKQHMEINAIDFGILKSDQELSSRNQRGDRPESFDCTMMDISQEGQPTSNNKYVSSLLSLAPPGTESSYMGSHIQHKSISQCPRELVPPYNILDSSLGLLEPLPANISGTSPCVATRIFDLGEGKCGCGTIPPAQSFLFRVEKNDNHVRSISSSKRKLSDTNILKVREDENCNDVSRVLSDNLSRRNNYPPAFREEPYKKLNNFSSINMFSTCAHEANTMRMHTSAEDLGGFTPRYQVNHTFPVMEKTGTYWQKKDENFKDSKVHTLVQENAPIKCFSIPQLIGQGKQGVKIVVLSSDSEGDGDVNVVSATEVVSKNASAETNTVDMNVIKEEHVSGVQSSSSKKNVSANTNSPHPDLAIGTPGENVQSHKCLIPAIPDMNVQLHVEPSAASVVPNADPSTSQTRRLDMNHAPDESSGWIQRLKISDTCNHFVGTKSLRLDETTTNKKANQFVSKGRGESSNSERAPVSTGKELMIVNQEKTPPRAAVSSSNDNVDGTKRLHSWIQRWQKSPTATAKNKSEPVAICDPQTFKVSLEELEKKPFSSIAAMALLGKGWSGLKCNYRNEGTYTVWET